MPPRPGRGVRRHKAPGDAVNDRPFLARPQPWKGEHDFILIGDREVMKSLSSPWPYMRSIPSRMMTVSSKAKAGS